MVFNIRQRVMGGNDNNQDGREVTEGAVVGGRGLSCYFSLYFPRVPWSWITTKIFSLTWIEAGFLTDLFYNVLFNIKILLLHSLFYPLSRKVFTDIFYIF